MTYSEMLDLLDQWVRWMRTPEKNSLGYPSRSSGMSSGGSVRDFDDLFESVENDKIISLNTAIGDLEYEERNAIMWRYFKQKPKPMYYELKLQIATENLLKKIEEKFGY